MKRRLALIFSFYCMTVIPCGEAHEIFGAWKQVWSDCQGYTKLYDADWHTHPSTRNYKHLMKSATPPHVDTDFSTYTPHPGSPWYQIWSNCVGPLQWNRWYFFDDCVESVWSFSGHCRNDVVFRFINDDTTYPQFCDPR